VTTSVQFINSPVYCIFSSLFCCLDCHKQAFPSCWHGEWKKYAEWHQRTYVPIPVWTENDWGNGLITVCPSHSNCHLLCWKLLTLLSATNDKRWLLILSQHRESPLSIWQQIAPHSFMSWRHYIMSKHCVPVTCKYCWNSGNLKFVKILCSIKNYCRSDQNHVPASQFWPQ
jgi:hypothetical protein